MAIATNKSYIITDDVTGEEIKLSLLANGNIKLEQNCSEIRMDIFEQLVEVAKELIQ